MTKLLEKIRNSHIDYLETDSETKRDELYIQLRGEILNYLSQENLTTKFTQREFTDLLEYNIENRPDFSTAGTSQAFEALEKYANNLLLYAWRNEFRIIKMYGGFFKHKVARHLNGVEKIFKLMGYKQSDDYTLVFVDPLNPEKLIEVSLNCIIASCECTLIEDFYQLTINAGCRCGYKEVIRLRKGVKEKTSAYKNNIEKPSSYFSNGHNGDYKFRDNYSGKRETLHPEDLYEQVRKPNRLSLDKKTAKTLPTKDKTRDLLKPETHDRHIEASISALNDLGATNKLQNQQAETRADTWDYVDKKLAHPYDSAEKQKIPVEDDDTDLALRRHHKANQLLEGFPRPQSDSEMIGNRSNYYYPFPPPYPPYVISGVMAHPLGALIPCPPPPGYRYSDFPDPRSGIALYPAAGDPQFQQRASGTFLDANGMLDASGGHGELRTSQRSSFYDNVSSDYAQERISDQTKQWNKEVNSSKYPDNFDDPMLSPPSPFNKNDEFLIETDCNPQQKTETDSKKNKSKRHGVKEKTPPNLQNRESREEKRSSSSGSSSVLSIDEDQWQCPSCTMLNKSGDKICYMCSRSRTKGPEAIPLQSGGKECAQCTYINEAKAKTCSVCLMPLSHEISSTYV